MGDDPIYSRVDPVQVVIYLLMMRVDTLVQLLVRCSSGIFDFFVGQYRGVLHGLVFNPVAGPLLPEPPREGATDHGEENPYHREHPRHWYGCGMVYHFTPSWVSE